MRADGTIYFTDPTYGLGSAPSEVGFTGLYRIDRSGVLHLEAKIDGQPNGVGFAPGERTLFVAATTANRLLAYTVASDESLTSGKTFANVDAPDGFALDQAGNLYVAGLVGGHGALVVIDAAGRTLGAVPLDQQPTHCAFGGSDRRTLFVTARTALDRISVPIAGR